MAKSYPIDIYIYSITIFQVLCAVVVGLLAIRKYFRYKHPALFYFGLSFLLVNTPWLAYIVNYTFYLFTEKVLTLEIFYLIGYLGPVSCAAAWVLAIFNSIHKRYLNSVTIFLIITLVIYYIFFIILLNTRMDLIGDVVGFWKIQYGAFLQVFISGSLAAFIITTILFGLNARKTNDKEIQFKAVVFFLMTIFFSSGSLIEIIPFIDVALASVSRTLITLSSFSIYISVVYPRWIQKLVLKEEYDKDK